MEAVTSAVMSDLISRAISFLVDKCRNRACLEEDMERLQRLLLRVRTVVEEADGRCITNSGMLMQLKMLADGMYRGYYVLHNFRYRPFTESSEEEVSGSRALFSAPCVKRFRTKRSTHVNDELQGALKCLENLIDTMKEFVILLGGCERMYRSPYDRYLYVDNFMFSRHVEKQQVINTLLQNNGTLGAPAVLPIIGGYKVGKKTLVWHVCSSEKIRSNFSSILHIGSDNMWKMDHARSLCERTLVVVEFVSDVEENEWMKFYSSLSRMNEGSKVIIISRLEKHARFGTTKPIHLNLLTQEEYSYLFKVLSFGSTNPVDYPLLASVGNELATLLGGSFVTANILRKVLRKNLSIHFWLHILKRCKEFTENNLSLFGCLPKCSADEREPPIDITKLLSSPVPLLLLPPPDEGDVSRSELPRVIFGDLILGTASPPKKKFEIVVWESRLAPYSRHIQICVERKPQCDKKT